MILETRIHCTQCTSKMVDVNYNDSSIAQHLFNGIASKQTLIPNASNFAYALDNIMPKLLRKIKKTFASIHDKKNA